MGKKGRGSGKSSGGSTAKVNWTPYLAVLVVLAASAAFYSLPRAGGSDGSATSDPGSAPDRSLADLEAEMTRLHAGLASVAARGGSGLFAKIKAMADQAQEVMAKAAAAGSAAEKKLILQEGLRSKTKWLLTLQEHATGLKKEEAVSVREHGVAPQAGGAIVALSVDNFTDFVATNPRTMVEFYAPWCPHCRKFAPEYQAIAEEFTGKAAFAIVNGEEQKQLARIYGVGRYPTLKWMVHGRAIDYDGPPSKARLSKWVEERLTPAYVDVDSMDDVTAALEQGGGGSGAAKICAGHGLKDSRQHAAFVAAAEHFRGKLVFTWGPPAAGSSESELRLHHAGQGPDQSPDICGAHAGGAPSASACETAEDVIAWLDDGLLFDPELQ
mmetsp:Transcript_8954/g.21228  ORF Transcript_8954/g.21228 Transcript_8954/m.21228 type:complete len:383 (-) Transcript_8954:72-1220(-)